MEVDHSPTVLTITKLIKATHMINLYYKLAAGPDCFGAIETIYKMAA